MAQLHSHSGERAGGTPFEVLVRQRLVHSIESATSSPLVHVVAPAGWGKTVAVDHWSQATERRVLRVAVDGGHNDPDRFFSSILDVITAVTQSDTDGARATLQGSSAFVTDETIEAVARALISAAPRSVLIFDNFEELESATVLDAFNRLRDLLRSDVTLMILSRHDPPIAVARDRASGQLAEIRQQELSFTRNEVADLAELEGIDLNDGDIQALTEATEGWCAVLRLAILWLQRSGSGAVITALSSDRIEIASYVIEEILEDLDPEARAFVLTISLADQLPEGLAESLTGRSDAGAMLSGLSAAGFPINRDPVTGVFAIHNLVRDLLRARAVQVADLDRAQLTARIAAWYEDRDPAEAVEYTIRSGDVEGAIERLADATGALADSGRSRTLYQLTDRLIRMVDEPPLLLLVSRGTALYGLGTDPDELWSCADRILEQMERLPEGPEESVTDGSNPRSWTVRSHLPWARATIARLRGDADAVLAERAFVPSDVGFLEGDVGEAMAWLGQYDDARELLDINAQHAARIGYAPGSVHCSGVRSLILAESGHLAAAEDMARSALATATERGFGQLRYAMYARLTLALVAWLRGDTAGATRELNEMQDFVDHADDVPIHVQHAIIRSNVRWSAGDRVGARATIDLASTTHSGRPVSGHFGDRLVLERARMDLLEGETFESERWFGKTLEHGASVSTMREELTLRRFAVVSGKELARAEQPLPEDLNPTALAEHRAALLRAEAFRATDRVREADNLLADERRRAESMGVRVFVTDESSRLTDPDAGAAVPYVRSSANLPEAPVYIEPLTDREREVLILMQTHMSYPEIAGELYVSINTVRSHTKSIFRKLAVTRRTDAVARAYEYQLV